MDRAIVMLPIHGAHARRRVHLRPIVAMDTVTLHSALPEVAAGAPPPEWLHLVPAGTVRGIDGRGPYTLAAPASVITASMAGGKIAIDENHAIDHAKKSGIPSPARGWVDRMEARADGVWGHVEWTPSGAALMAERAYRGLSPAMEVTLQGSVLRVLRASLTNAPNLGELTTLHSKQDADMDIAALRAALGLPDTADEAACLARVRENATVVSAHSQAVKAIADAAGVTAADERGLITALQTQRASSGDLVGKVTTLQTELTTLQTERARDKAVTFVDGAIKAGKPIAPLRDHYIARHAQDAASVELEVGKLASINAGGVTQEQVTLQAAAGDGMGELTADDHAVAAKMGIDPKKFAEHKAKMKGSK